MRPIILLIAILLFVTSSITGQSSTYGWGKLSLEERQMTMYHKDSTANAVILMNYGRLNINKSFFTLKYYKRIKLLKEAAFELADVSLPYYSKDNTERITSIKARITQPNGSSVELTKKDFFTKKINDYLKAKTFAFPNVQEGAILEYEYTVESNDLFHLRQFYFQDAYPIVLSKLFIIPHEEMDYAIILQNYQENKVEREDKFNNITYTITDVPAFKEEPFVTCFDDYYIKIIFQLRFFQRAFLTDWKKTANTLKYESFFGQQYLKKRNYKKALAEVLPLVSKIADPKEKVKTIYHYLNKVMQWNGQYAYSVATNLSDVYENKVGRSGELNLLLIALLKEIGITVHPVLLSTREHGKMIQTYPIMEQFNHVIAQVIFEKDTWLLDLSNKHRPVNYIRADALNYYGWVVKDKTPEWININAPLNTEFYEGHFNLTQDGSIEGTLDIKQKGYSAFSDRASIEEKTIGTIWQNRLEEQWSELEIQDITFKNEDTPEKILETTIKCNISNASLQANDFLYLNPVVYTSWNENIFKSPERLYSVDMAYPMREQFKYTIQIPSDYSIEELPENIKFTMPEGEGVFSYVIVPKEDQTITVLGKLLLSKVFFPSYKYTALRAFFDVVANKLQEQIVLKKME